MEGGFESRHPVRGQPETPGETQVRVAAGTGLAHPFPLRRARGLLNRVAGVAIRAHRDAGDAGQRIPAVHAPGKVLGDVGMAGAALLDLALAEIDALGADGFVSGPVTEPAVGSGLGMDTRRVLLLRLSVA
jgi:hypothetical protein